MQIKLHELEFSNSIFGFYGGSDVINLFNHDCDDCVDTGIYFLRANTTHSASSTPCVMLVIRFENGQDVYIHQFFLTIGFNGINKRIKYPDGNWSGWYELNFTQTQ